MSFHVKDDFKARSPISQVPASWFNAIARFINNLVGGVGIRIIKNDSGRSVISLDEELLAGLRVKKDIGTPDDKSDKNDNDDNDGNVWTWTAGGKNGLTITPYCEIEQDQGWHYFGCAKLTFSKDGLLVSAEGLPGRKEIQG